MRKCITSFASLGREDYRKAQLGLIRSCVEKGWDGEYVMSTLDGYCDEYLGVKISSGSWPISERYGTSFQQIDIPYQFKCFQIQAAREAGYSKIFWMDSTCRLISNPQPLFDLAAQRGIVAWNNLGFPLIDWTNDTTLRYFNETVESLQGVKQIMACCILFDFDNPITEPIFEKWIQASFKNVFMNDETVRNGFRESRHDQTAISILLHQYNIPLNEYGDGFCYHPHHLTKEFGDKPIYAINKGID